MLSIWIQRNTHKFSYFSVLCVLWFVPAEVAKASLYPVSFAISKHANDSLEKSLSCNWYRHSFIYCEPTNSKRSFSLYLSVSLLYVCHCRRCDICDWLGILRFWLHLSLIASLGCVSATNAAKFIWLSAHTRSNRVHLIWYSVSTHTTWEIRLCKYTLKAIYIEETPNEIQ